MSHKMTAKTNLMEEHTDVIAEQVSETWEGATVVYNAKPAGVYNAPVCEVVIRRPGHHADIGLKVRDDGSGVYDVHMYNPGYGNDQERMVNELEKLYENYNIATTKKVVKKAGHRIARTSDAVSAKADFGNGEEECRMVEIHLGDSSTPSVQRNQSSTTGGYN